MSIKAQKDPAQTWYDLPYLETCDAIDAVLDRWPVEWCTISSLAVVGSKSAAQKKKEEAKLKMTQLAKKRKKEVLGKAQVERNATQQIEK